MSDSLSRDEREKRAFDALIVSNLLRDRDPEDLDDLPELPEAMKARMNSMSSDLVSKLWAKTPEGCEEECEILQEESFQEDEQFAGSGANRVVDDMDEETKKKLDEARRLARETMLKKKRKKDDANS
jgi:hypothetical protein